jgi:hypothetical protein
MIGDLPSLIGGVHCKKTLPLTDPTDTCKFIGGFGIIGKDFTYLGGCGEHVADAIDFDMACVIIAEALVFVVGFLNVFISSIVSCKMPMNIQISICHCMKSM